MISERIARLMKIRLLITNLLLLLNTIFVYADGLTFNAKAAKHFDFPLVEKIFLAGMPEADQKTLSDAYLIENLEMALKARSEFPWSKSISDDLFLNDVLPYAVVDETRENWRKQFYTLSRELVKDCTTASEAAQALNRELFDKINVHYSRKRNKPNQSPAESIAINKASCTGLSIILVYACRAVGIPARIVGTPRWSDNSGNHTWVEIWDGEWKFLGADEYDPKGLNRSWLVGRASKAKADQWQHAIWATSWQERNTHFPLVWDLANKSVGAVNVTDKYTSPANKDNPAQIGIRVFAHKGGPRIEAEVSILGADSKVTTKAGSADFNDIAYVNVSGNGPWTLLIQKGLTTQKLEIQKITDEVVDVYISQTDNNKFFNYSAVIEKWQQDGRNLREQELKQKSITIEDFTLRYLEKKFGKQPKSGHALWISLHGGGGAPKQVNDQQWRNQINLYQPKEGYYVAPRAPTDTWNLWHRSHIDLLFDRLIANYVICRGVDPNRVYLLGYSAGGDGVYQLAPRMADRFAGAAMMAGHPNETKPDGLRNLPFEIFVGGRDTAYNRHKKAANWKGHLENFQAADPNGYPHRVTIYPDLGHWMQRKDAEVIPRLIKLNRREWPKKIAWLQDDTTHQRFYWLGVKPEGAIKRRLLKAEVNDQTILVTGEDVSGLKFWLSDELINLDQPITVKLNGKQAFQGIVPRSKTVVAQSLNQRCGMIATALLKLE